MVRLSSTIMNHIAGGVLSPQVALSGSLNIPIKTFKSCKLNLYINNLNTHRVIKMKHIEKYQAKSCILYNYYKVINIVVTRLFLASLY